MRLPQDLQETADALAELSDQERLEELIRLGKQLPPFPESEKTEDNQIVECLTDAYVSVTKNQDGTVHIQAYVEPLIVRGVVVLVLRILEGKTPEEVVRSENTIRTFIKQSRLDVSTIPSRVNTLMGLIEIIRRKAKKLR